MQDFRDLLAREMMVAFPDMKDAIDDLGIITGLEDSTVIKAES